MKAKKCCTYKPKAVRTSAIQLQYKKNLYCSCFVVVLHLCEPLYSQLLSFTSDNIILWLWNYLPTLLRDHSLTLTSFSRQLKTFLYSRAYIS